MNGGNAYYRTICEGIRLVLIDSRIEADVKFNVKKEDSDSGENGERAAEDE